MWPEEAIHDPGNVLDKSEFINSYFGGVPESQYFDVGSDSEVYLLKLGEKTAILKLYHRAGINKELLTEYQRASNNLNQSLNSDPLEIDCGGIRCQIEVTPILNVGQTEQMLAYSVSPYVAGENLERITATVNVAYNHEPENAETLTRPVPAMDDESKIIQVPYPKIHEFFRQGFWVMNPKREELRIQELLNKRVGGFKTQLDPKNIKFRISPDLQESSLIITDIHSTLQDLAQPNR